MASNTPQIIQSNIIALALRGALGIQPAVTYTGDTAVISYQGKQLKTAQANFSALVSGKSENKIRVDFWPVVQPEAIKKAIPYLIGAFALGYLLK